MAFRLAVIISLIAIASAGVIDYQGAAPVSVPLVKSYAPTVVKAVSAPVYKQVEYDAPAEYEFNYAVHDEHTGDIKSQQESRKGDVVQGYYELIEPDGHRRIVEYTADAHNGFNAVVHREPTNIQIPQPVPQVHKLISPVAQYAPVAKVTYAAAPVTKAISYSAPVAKVIAPTVAKYAVPATHYSSGHENSQVTFNGPASNYHY